MGSLKVDDVPVIMSIRREVNREIGREENCGEGKETSESKQQCWRIKDMRTCENLQTEQIETLHFWRVQSKPPPTIIKKTIILIKNDLYGNI